MRSYAVLMPSRGRPDAVGLALGSIWATAAHPDRLCAVIRVDHDDPELAGYHRLLNWKPLRLLVGPRNTMSGLWDEAATAAPVASVLFCCGDDVRFQTPGWDTMVDAAFDGWPDGIGVVYGRDGVGDERVSTQPFVGRGFRDVLGHLCPGLFDGDYIDLWVHEVADAVGRLRYLPGLYTEHLHPAVGKAEMDATYQEKIDRMQRQRTHEVWDAAAALRALDVARLREAISG